MDRILFRIFVHSYLLDVRFIYYWYEKINLRIKLSYFSWLKIIIWWRNSWIVKFIEMNNNMVYFLFFFSSILYTYIYIFFLVSCIYIIYSPLFVYFFIYLNLQYFLISKFTLFFKILHYFFILKLKFIFLCYKFIFLRLFVIYLKIFNVYM